jgi:hypothetical protein
MVKIFADDIHMNGGNSASPSVTFISNTGTGLFLHDENSVGIASNRQVVAVCGNTNIELFKKLKISSGSKNGATLTSDTDGVANWRMNQYKNSFLWNSLYKSLNSTIGNNIAHITFPSPMENIPHVSLTKESNHIIDNFDVYLKNKTTSGFDIYTNTIMYKQLLGGQIGQYSTCRLTNGNIAIAYYDITLDRLRYITVDSQFKDISYPITIEDVSVTNVCKMAIVDNRPAIFYIAADDVTGDSVWKYIWATNSSGTAWYTPIVLATANTDLSFDVNNLFLLVIDGKPVVFFHNESNQVQMIKSINNNGGAGWEPSVTISDLTSHNILDVKQISGTIMMVAKSTTTNKIHYTYSVDNGVTWDSSAVLDKSDNTALLVNASSSSNILSVINGVTCIISSELDTNMVYVNILNGTTWSGYRFLTDANTGNISPSVFINNDTTYLLYNSYSGSASKKTLIEFSDTFIADNTFVQTDGFVDNFNFGTDQQTISNLNDGNNAIILGSNSGISLLKFYGNDFAISWSATL